MIRKLNRLRTKPAIVGTCLLLCVYLAIAGVWSPRLVVRDFIYLTRPIWDDPGNEPEIIIPHFHANTMPIEKLCPLHGWQQRVSSIPKVIDAMIFSIELDMLEIRMKELWDVVDTFLVMEADRTFTGRKKPLYLKNNMDRFDWAKTKLVHIAIENSLSENPKKHFDNEVRMRGIMTRKVESLGAQLNDLIIVGDVDEIPSKETIKLLKSCEGYPQEIHLQLRNYLYSFEFYMETTNWKPHVSVYTPGEFYYHHHKMSFANHQLGDAGWHCSFCFRYISDIVFKMTGYSHSDRVTSQKLLITNNIQEKICNGADIYDMFPEAYTFRKLISQMGNIPRRPTTIGIPSYIVENSEKFKFLLPGGCIRENSLIENKTTV